MGARRVLLQAVRGLARAHLINLQPLLRPTVDETSRSRFSRVGVALRRCGFASSPDTFFQKAVAYLSLILFPPFSHPPFFFLRPGARPLDQSPAPALAN